MSEHNRNILKSSSGVALATFICRILGLFREMLTAKYLGGGAFASAWALGFMVPNMFRRLFGEGALGSALMPIIAHTRNDEGNEGVRRKITAIFAILGILLALISILVSGISMAIEPFVSVERVKLTLQILPLLMPYAFFICLIGAMGAVLNTYKVFFIPALGALSFNICMIVCLLGICPYLSDKPVNILYWLSLSVLVSGFLQLILMIYLLKRSGILPFLKKSVIVENFRVIKELWHLVLPGLIGASAVQVGFLIDRGCACFLGDYAVPALNYTDRIIDLPIGIFAVSFGAVSLSNLSGSAAKENTKEMINSIIFMLRHILFVSIPTAVFFIIFKIPIIRILFMRGRFDEDALRETAWALMFFSLGIPAFSTVKILLSGFYAGKDMKTPVKISFVCIGINIVLNFILMWPLAQGGIALATVISSILNNLLLYYFLRKKIGEIPLGPLARTTILSLSLSVLFGILAYYIYGIMEGVRIPYMPMDFLPLSTAIMVFGAGYAAFSLLFKSRELPEILELIIHRKKS